MVKPKVSKVLSVYQGLTQTSDVFPTILLTETKWSFIIHHNVEVNSVKGRETTNTDIDDKI